MAKRQQKRQKNAQLDAVQSQQAAPPEVSECKPDLVAAAPLPTVSLCTVTYNRSAFLPLLQRHILAQTYPRHRLEWVLVDDSDDGKPEFQPDPSQGLTIVHKRLDKRLPLGEKRNLSHTFCRGDIIVYLDDDDYYPPTRVSHAVERLLASDSLVAGSTILPILFLPERELWVAGPYGNHHATAGTFAFKRQLLEQTRYDDEKTFAEEKSFLKNYTFPMVQLDAGQTILCMAHDRNTFEKRTLIAAGKNPRFRKLDQENTGRLLAQLKDVLPSYERLLHASPEDQGPGLQQARQTPASQPANIRITRLSQNQPAASETVAALPKLLAVASPVVEEVNLCIVSHPQDIFSLCFLDVARYLRHRLRLLEGIKTVHLSKNRLYHDAVNIVLGAHVGLQAIDDQGYKCIFVNLEQLGQTGKAVRQEYLDLLKNNAVIDYDTSNLVHYRQDNCQDVAILSFGYAPYLQTSIHALESLKPLREREIDLLFYGSMNESRHHALTRLARCGSEIRVLDNLFGPERDAVIRNSKLVLNLSFYEKGAFEQVRAFHCLSLGTPMLSVTSGNTSNVPASFRHSVFWRSEEQACDFLRSEFKTEAFYSEAQSMLSSYRHSPHETLGAEQQQLRQLLNTVGAAAPREARHQSRRIYLGSGHVYKPGWINIDVDRATYPDLVLDLCNEIDLPLLAHSPYSGAIKIAENSMDKILADNVLEHVSDLPRLMTNCLRMLVVGGQMEIVVPYESSQAAWQDPTHVRAFNERSWLYYTEWCWRLGWFHHHFKVQSFAYLDIQAKSVLKDSAQAFFMRVVMIKERATPKDRNRYRLLRSDFGPGLDDDGDAS